MPLKVGSGGQHVPASVHERPAEIGIKEVFLRDLPGDDFAHLRARRTWNGFRGIGAFPRLNLLARRSDAER